MILLLTKGDPRRLPVVRFKEVPKLACLPIVCFFFFNPVDWLVMSGEQEGREVSSLVCPFVCGVTFWKFPPRQCELLCSLWSRGLAAVKVLRRKVTLLRPRVSPAFVPRLAPSVVDVKVRSAACVSRLYCSKRSLLITCCKWLPRKRWNQLKVSHISS